MNVQTRRWMVRATRIGTPLAIVLVGAVAFALLEQTAPHVRMQDAAVRSAAQVKVFQARLASVQRQWQGYGSARAKTAVNVPTRVQATVKEVPARIEEGMAVKKGQLLARLDPSDFQRQVEIASEKLDELAAQIAAVDVQQKRLHEQLELEKKQVKLSRDELERVRKVVDQGAGNQQDIDTARGSLIQAQLRSVQTARTLDQLGPQRRQLEARQSAQRASLKLAQQNLDRTHIVSPITGVLQTVDVKQGESVAPGQRIARVVSLNVLEVPVRLPTQARTAIHVGDEVKLWATNGTKACWGATVARLSPGDDPNTRTGTAYVEVNQRRLLADPTTGRWLLRPGVFVRATVTGDKTRQRWIVPQRAVRNGRVRLVNHGKVRSRPVAVDYTLQGSPGDFNLPDDQWAVLSEAAGGGPPLKRGELVMVNASQSLLDGQQVVPAPVPPARPGLAKKPSAGSDHLRPTAVARGRRSGSASQLDGSGEAPRDREVTP